MAIAFPKSWRTRLVSLLVLLAVIVLGTYAYNAVAVRVERRHFEQARAAVDRVYADIVKQLGQPDSYRRVSECSRTSVEFGQGPLSCDVGTDAAYGVSDVVQANKLNAKIVSVMTANSFLFHPASEPPTDISINRAPGVAPDNSVSYYTLAGLLCAVKHTYDMPREIQLTIKDPSKKIFGVSIGCDGSARTEYYPINS